MKLIFSFLSAVSERLPVALTPNDVQDNPEFNKLLTALTRHILPSGAFITSEEDIRKVSVVVCLFAFCSCL